MSDKKVILDIRDLSISFETSAGELKAVRGVNLQLLKGETLAIVGESGSGKSVTARAVMGILSNNEKVNTGDIEFTYEQNGSEVTQNLLGMSKKEITRQICGKHIAMVFQDPMTSLNPTMTIGAQLTEGMRTHLKMSRKEAFDKAVELLELVGITNPEKRMGNYPHQLSGGMRQRVVIAIAISCEPDILICDEPTTALDVTIQARILDLIKDIQKQKEISVIYITHNFGVVAKVADFVAVMYAGEIVEKGSANEVFFDPRHPYTWGLLSAMPDLDTNDERLYMIPGSPPNLLQEICGEAFAPRNPYALKIDYQKSAPVTEISETHSVRSWLLDSRAPKVELPAELKARIDKMKKEAC